MAYLLKLTFRKKSRKQPVTSPKGGFPFAHMTKESKLNL